MFFWQKKQRRQKILSEPFPAAWTGYLTENIRHYPLLERSKQLMVQAVVLVFAAEKNWESGRRGFEITDEMKATVAGQAALLVLGLDEPYYFDRVQSIILNPGTFRNAFRMHSDFTIVPRRATLAGQAWYHSPIILSWDSVVRCGHNSANGMNVVLHEFAHYLDGLDGSFDGTPPLDGPLEKTWYRVTEAEYLRLVGSARRGEITLLNHYGATNRAEFFAVATECFFEQPQAMRQKHAELYGVLQEFYRQDPAQWLPDAKISASCAERKSAAGADADVAESAGADELFTLAQVYLNEGRYDAAEQTTSRAIRLDPSDAELYQQRALARVYLGMFNDALNDCSHALGLDPDNLEAYTARGAAHVGLKHYDQAMYDLDYVLEQDNSDPDAHYFRGLAFAGMGQFDRAVSDFSASLDKRPMVADAYYQRALAEEKLSRTKDAEADFQQAFYLDPEADRVPWVRRSH